MKKPQAGQFGIFIPGCVPYLENETLAVSLAHFLLSCTGPGLCVMFARAYIGSGTSGRKDWPPEAFASNQFLKQVPDADFSTVSLLTGPLLSF